MPKDSEGSINTILERLQQLREENREPLGSLAGMSTLGLVMLLHSATGFSTTLLPLYVLPIWVATHLGGSKSGVFLVALSALASAFVHWRIGDAQTWQEILLASALSTLSLGVVMFLMARLEVLIERNHELAYRDPLTGLFNRRGLQDFGEKVIGRARREEESLVVVAIDCDGFKGLNDTFGHEAGDEVLQILARVLEAQTRNSDLVARVGGDEFVLVLDGLSVQDARAVLGRVEREFELCVAEAGYACTISVGIASMDVGQDTMDVLMETADRAMYRSKEMRRWAYLN